MVAFGIKECGGSQSVVFTIPLPNRPPVFMSTEVTRSKENESGIVIVDARKFLELWRNDTYIAHKPIANGTPQTWLNDRKYGHAAQGFSSGYDNPVPLACISHGMATRTIISYKFLWFGKNAYHEQYHYVTIANGITRTIWLLTKGCTAFPVKCQMPGARELYKMAAAPSTHFYTESELAEAVSHA